jgi:hypothetical protein
MGVTVFKAFSNWFKDVRRGRGMEAQLNGGRENQYSGEQGDVRHATEQLAVA